MYTYWWVLVGWGLTALLTQNRSYRAGKMDSTAWWSNAGQYGAATNLVGVCNVAINDLSINCEQDTEVEINSSRSKRHRLHQSIKEQRPATRVIHQTRASEQLGDFVKNKWLLRSTVAFAIDTLRHTYMSINRLPTTHRRLCQLLISINKMVTDWRRWQLIDLFNESGTIHPSCPGITATNDWPVGELLNTVHKSRQEL